MKTNFFLTSLIIILFSFTAKSQITKGNWMVGGDGYYSSFKSERVDGSGKYSPWAISINPNIGYFFRAKLATGATLNLSISKTSGRYILSPFIRYYFLKPNSMYNFFSSVSTGYGIRTDEYKTYKTSELGLKIGGVIYLNSIVGLEFNINYSKYYNEVLKNDFRTGYSNQITIGFGLQIHLEKDK